MSRWILAFALGIAACNAAEVRPDAPAPDPGPALEPPPLVNVYVGGEWAAGLAEADLRRGVRLDNLVAAHPYKTWVSITVAGKDLGPIAILKPAENYAGAAPRIELHAIGPRAKFSISPADGVAEEQIGIDDVRIELAADEPTPMEDLTSGCSRTRRGEAHPRRPPMRFRGDAHQFNTGTHWGYDLRIDLGPGRTGAHVGTLLARGPRSVFGDVACVFDLYRAADRLGQRVVTQRVRSGSCVDGTLAFSCTDKMLRVNAFYTTGEYVLTGLIAPDP